MYFEVTISNPIKNIDINFIEEAVVCHIHNLSDEVKVLIRKHLKSICYGEDLAAKNLSSQSYINTLKQFKTRYSEKDDNQKKGMIGELLTHVFIYEYFDKFDVISPFFNMEEKSQRKGFDLLLVSKNDNEVWITEVKSGELGINDTSDKAIAKFLHAAKRDLKNRLSQPEVTFWTNAINTASIAMENCTDYKDAVIKILDDEAVLAMTDEANSEDNNVVLASVLFCDMAECFSNVTSENVLSKIKEEGLFKKVIIFSIQKGTYKKIENFLFEEELDE